MNPIILLHGALGSDAQLRSIAQQLEQHGDEVFTFNFSGHGGSSFSKDGFGIEIFANELLTFLNDKAIARATIFGYSMGGYVALWAAYRRHERFQKIVTLGTKFDWSIASAANEIKKLDADKIELKVPAFAQELRRRHEPNDWREIVAKTANLMTDLGRQPLLTEEVIREIKLPVDILLGDRDETADLNSSRQVAAWLPFGKFELLPNTPHPIEKINEPDIIEKLLK